MGKVKKYISIGLMIVMGLSVCACGNDRKQEDTRPETSEEEVAEENMPDVEGDPIYIYSFDGDLGEKLQLFYERYPEYEKRVQFVNLEMGAASQEYQDMIKSLMKEGTQRAEDEGQEDGPEQELPKYPSVVANDSIMGYSFIQNDYSVSMDSLGITEADMQNMYPYTLCAASFQGEVKGLSYCVSPGAFLYRADIAQNVLGESSPEAVQNMLASWDGFLDVAKKMQEAGYKMLSGSDEITYAMLQDKQVPWVAGEELKLDASIRKCLELSKRLQEDEYAGDTLITSSEREASFESDVFGWFVYPGLVYAGIDAQTYDGDYRLCQGPNAFQWGSTYLTVSPECPDKELAALVIKTLCCNEEVLTKMAENDFVNNQSVMKAAAEKAEGMELLGGQKPLEVWLSVEDHIDAATVTPYDGRFDSWIQELSVSYNREKFEDISKVFEQFKDKVSDTFNYIMVK
ncbi:MAG: ABC transporter substrate-binding protein [Clostridium sp.]|nr:ABC transporter substrate-binding protein [Clostridium sp.]